MGIVCPLLVHHMKTLSTMRMKNVWFLLQLKSINWNSNVAPRARLAVGADDISSAILRYIEHYHPMHCSSAQTIVK